MELFLMRHGIAIERGEPGYEDDALRPLTPKGRKRLRDASRGMRQLGWTFDLVLTSPLARARETAEIVCEELECGRALEETPLLAPDGNPCELVEELAHRYEDRSSTLLVGHEPYLSRLASILVCGHPDGAIVLKKGGVCRLEVSALSYARCASLLALLTSRHLEAAR